MSDMNTNTQDQGTPAQAQTTPPSANGADDTPAKLYPTKADAEASRTADAPKSLKPFEVLHNGTSKGWLLARGHAHAIEQVARLDGYSASLGTKTAPVTKEAILAKLSELSDDELKALGLTRKPQRGRN
jgi:hypothetical protein